MFIVTCCLSHNLSKALVADGITCTWQVKSQAEEAAKLAADNSKMIVETESSLSCR